VEAWVLEDYSTPKHDGQKRVHDDSDVTNPTEAETQYMIMIHEPRIKREGDLSEAAKELPVVIIRCEFPKRPSYSSVSADLRKRLSIERSIKHHLGNLCWSTDIEKLTLLFSVVFTQRSLFSNTKRETSPRPRIFLASQPTA
jgi:hypothetical protein